MSERRRKKNLRFLKETSDRSGFDNWHRNDEGSFTKEWQSIKQSGLTLEPEEFDMPPPSNKPLGGADISGESRLNSTTTDVPPESVQQVQYLTATSTISVPNSDLPILITGSNSAVELSSNPKIAAGLSNQIIGVKCVGSGVTLTHGDGIFLHAQKPFSMISGAIMTLVYNSSTSMWYEASRCHELQSLGGL